MKADNPQVSVIVPVYNVEKYLKECVDSILIQTFTDFELIMVDDGSTDRSGAICDEYGGKYDFVKVVHQQHASLPSARKTGLERADGEYVLYVDSDDWVDSNHLENLVRTAEREKADVVLSGLILEYPRKKVRKTNVPASTAGREIVLENLYDRRHAGVVLMLVRKSLLVDPQIVFPKYNFFEDMYLTTQILLHAKRIAPTEFTTYHYRYNDSSETNAGQTEFRIRKYDEFILNMQELYDILSLWNDEQMRMALLHRINKEKLELLVLPFSAGKAICRAYDCYADSWRVYKTGFHLLHLLNYLALRYRVLVFAQLYKHLRVKVRKCLKG